ncbi:MAG: thioredoxin fold domain-containing protein [Bdellovibrionia bacterium]
MKMRALTGLVTSLVGIGLSFATYAQAALKAPDFTVQTTVAQGKVSVQATAPKSHHFNTEAPMSLELASNHSRLKPKKSAPTEVIFEVPSPAKDSAKVALFLCDDAKTFCERHLIQISWEGQAGASAAQKSAPSDAQKTSSTGPEIDEHGFYDNRPEAAFAKARATGKPLMIDFYGIWCPPCNEMNDSVFSKPAFKENASAFVQLKLDADAPMSEGLSQRYGIQGFPTVIFASPQGDEISRVVGYRPMDQFVAEMKGALANQSLTFVALQAKAKKGDRAASDRVGTIYLDRGEYDHAYRFLKNTQQEKEKLSAAEVGLYEAKAKAGDKKARSKWIAALQKAIAEFPNSPDSIMKREELAQAFDEAKQADDAKKVRQDLVASAQRILAKPESLKGYDLTESDLYSSVADAYAELGDKTKSDAAWALAADIIRKKIEAGAERGGTLDLAYCLRKLGKTDEAAKLYQKMQQAYPKEFTFWLADAKMNMQLKNYERARELAQTAYENSYGANKLDSAFVLASALKSLGKTEQGKKTITQALESVPPLPPTANQAARSRIRSKVSSLYKLSAELGKNTG